MVSLAVITHHDQKQPGEESVYFGFQFHFTVHHGEKSGQELKQGRSLYAGAAAEATKERCHRLALHDLLSLLRITSPGVAMHALF